MEVYVDGSKLILQEPKLSEAPVATITWHEELHNFTTSVSLSKQQQELKVSGWDMVKKEATTYTAKKGDERNLMGGTRPGAENVAVFSPEANWRATTPDRSRAAGRCRPVPRSPRPPPA